MIMKTERLALKSPHEVGAAELCDYYWANRDYSKEYEPIREDAFYTEEYQNTALDMMRQEWETQKSYRFFICLDDQVIGTIALNNIVMGPFRSCFLGYGLDGRYTKQGYMTETVQKIIEFAFQVVKLHRIEGNVMPKNLASRAILKKCNFICEGISKKYLKINGIWEDHLHYVLLNDALE